MFINAVRYLPPEKKVACVKARRNKLPDGAEKLADMKTGAGEFVVMGVSGCGKSVVGKMLADRTHGEFIDGDDFHPPGNKAKMSAGIPLTDEDRWGWLDVLNRKLRSHAASERPLFLACSALRQVYRDRLSAGVPNLRFIYLKGSKELMRERVQNRKNHFMPATLLDSQFATLEEPLDAIVVGVDNPLAIVVDAALHRIEEATD